MAITDKQRKLMRDLISNTDKSAKNIAKKIPCCERTVRTEAERIGNDKFKEKHAAARVSSSTQNPGTVNYLADMQAGFPRKKWPLEGLTSNAPSSFVVQDQIW